MRRLSKREAKRVRTGSWISIPANDFVTIPTSASTFSTRASPGATMTRCSSERRSAGGPIGELGAELVMNDLIREAAHRIDPVFRDSPQFVSEPIGDRLGMRLLCKVETMNPIRSFK